MPIAALLLQAATPPAPVFAPPEGVRLRYETVEERSVGDGTRRFTDLRHVVFSHDAGGLVADMTFDPPAVPPTDTVAKMAARATAGLRGRSVRFHLDPQGRVVAIDDQTALWSALCDSFADAGDTAERRKSAAAIAAAMRALPADRQRAMLASSLAPLIEADARTLAAGTDQAVTLGAESLGPGAASLPGTLHVAEAEDRRLRLVTHAQGDVGVPAMPGNAATGAPRAVHVAIDRERVVDPATGLVWNTRETTETRLSDATGSRLDRKVSTARLSIEVP